MAVSLRRPRAARLSEAFARAIERGGRGAPARDQVLVGIEHEFRVLEGERRVDFRRLIHDLPIPGRRIDATDPNAYRGRWGGTITTDGLEAELAIAPQPVGAGFSAAALGAALRGRRELRGAVPATLRLEGYSTHVSVSVPVGREERIARLFVDRFAVALLMLVDGPESPGLLVRPRPGRLELGGEFVDGDRLRAAIVFAVGAAIACRRAARPGLGRFEALPPVAAVAVEAATERYGWLVTGAAGASLHADGRATRLGRQTAQEHFEGAWRVARRALGCLASDDEVELVDQIVAGDQPLGLELSQPEGIAQVARADTPLTDDPSGFGSLMALRRRPGLLVEPEVVSWDFVVLRITEDLVSVRGRSAFACLPRAVLGPALDALDRGHLDAILRAYLALGADARMLAGAPQTRRAGLYGVVAAGAKLAAKELGPDIPGLSHRPGKRQRQPQSSQPQPSTPPSPPVPPAAVPIAAAGAAAVTIFGLSVKAAAAAAAAIATVAVIGGTIMLGGGTPAPTSSPGASEGVCMAAEPYDLWINNPGSKLADLTQDQRNLIVAALEAYDFAGDATSVKWRDDTVAAITSGDYATAGLGMTNIVAGVVVINRCGGSGPVGPGTSATPGAGGTVVFHSGGTDLTIVSNGGAGTLQVPLTAGQIDDAGHLFVFWSDGMPDPIGGGTTGITQQLELDGSIIAGWTPTIAGDTGVDFSILIDTGDQIHGSTALDLQCDVAAVRTPTGGVSGTLGCTGTDQDSTVGGFQVDGTFWAEPAAAPVPTEPPFVQDFTGGTASMRVSGGANGSIDAMLFANELTTSDPDVPNAPEYPGIVWSDKDAINTFAIWTLTKHATGALSTADGTLGVGWNFDSVDWGGGVTDWYPGGIGLGEQAPGPGLSCTATITANVDKTISGTVSCPNVNDPTLPVQFEATFQADFSDNHYGGGTVLGGIWPVR